MRAVHLLFGWCGLVCIKLRNLVVEHNCSLRTSLEDSSPNWLFTYWLDVIVGRLEKTEWVKKPPIYMNTELSSVIWNRIRKASSELNLDHLTFIIIYIFLFVWSWCVYIYIKKTKLRSWWWYFTCAFNNSKSHMIQLDGFSVSFWLTKNVGGFKVPARQCSSYLFPNSDFLNCYNSRGDEGREKIELLNSVLKLNIKLVCISKEVVMAEGLLCSIQSFYCL